MELDNLSDEMSVLKLNEKKILYKYFPSPGATKYAEENLLTLLSGGCIRLTGADEVNDPFENEPSFVGDISRDDIYKHHVRIYDSNELSSPHLLEARQDLRQRFPTKFSLKKSMPIIYREAKDKIPIAFRDGMRKTAFCCLAERPDSQLMWAHYAASHKGICVGFSRKYGQFPKVSVPVKYSPNRVPVDLASYLRDWESGDVDKAIFEILTTKSLDWAYEKEWRFIGVPFQSMARSDVGDLVDFSRDAIAEIIFGERTDNKTKELVKAAVFDLKLGPKFYQASISPSTYRIDIVPLA